jgi:hypothetical protein
MAYDDAAAFGAVVQAVRDVRGASQEAEPREAAQA